MRARLLPFAATAGIAVLLVLAACQGPAGAGSTSPSASPSPSASVAASPSSSAAAAGTHEGQVAHTSARDALVGADGRGISGIWFIAKANGKLPSASAWAKATASASSGYGY